MAESGNIDKASKEAAKSTKETAAHAETLSENLARSGERLKEISAEATESGNALRDMAKSMKESAKDGGDFSNAISFGAGLAAKLSKTSEAIAKFSKENLGASQDTEKVLRRQKIVKGQIQEVESQIKFLQDAKANASKAERIEISKTVKKLTDSVGVAEDLLGNMQEIAEANDKLNDSTAWLDGMSDLVGDIPVVGKMFGEFSKAAKQARKDGVEGGDALKAGMGAVGKAAGKLITAFSVKTIIGGMYEASQRTAELGRDLNLSKDAAYDLNQEFIYLSSTIQGINSKDLIATTMAMTTSLGTMTNLSDEVATNFTSMTKRMGLGADAAAQMTKLSGVTSKNGKDTVNVIVGQVTALNDAEGTAIRYQDVMSDIAGAGAAQQLSISKQPGGLAKAAFQARKLGLNFAQLESSANSLLDFESSISAELEAELLTGKQLNLETARMAALRGDDALLAEELAKNLGSAADFAKLNRLEQQKLAAAFGMSKDEAAQMLINREAMEKFGASSVGQMEDEAKAQLKLADSLEKQGKLEDAKQLRAEVYNKLGKSEIADALSKQSIQEKQEAAMLAMGDAAAQLQFLLTPVVALFTRMSEMGSASLGFITKMGSKLGALGKFAKDFSLQFKFISQTIAKSGKGITTLFKALGSGIKIAGKGGIKSLLKKIPILGALVGAGMAYSRAKKGDWLGAGAELLSGIASIFPGIGTGISVGIDAGLMASDMAGYTGGNPNADKAAAAKKKQGGGLVDDVAADFISRPGQPIQKFRKDDIILGATNPMGGSGNNEAVTLLKEIALAIKQGGDVYMDGNKVGQSLMLASSKMS